MKTIFFALVIFFFTSCTKEGAIDLNNTDWSFLAPPLIGDSSNKVKADIAAGGTNYQLSAVALNTSFTRYVLNPNSDSSTITIMAFQGNAVLELDLINIKTAGTYPFGHNPGHSEEVRASYSVNGGSFYNNDHNVLSGSITIDNLANKHIQGTFSVTCWDGTQAAYITNGSFTGNYF